MNHESPGLFGFKFTKLRKLLRPSPFPRNTMFIQPSLVTTVESVLSVYSPFLFLTLRRSPAASRSPRDHACAGWRLQLCARADSSESCAEQYCHSTHARSRGKYRRAGTVSDEQKAREGSLRAERYG